MHAGGGPGYLAAERDAARAHSVDWITGAVFATRKSIMTEIGGFDRGYYFYFEDTDLCKRIRLSGRELWFDPAIEVIHHLSQSRPSAVRSEVDRRQLRAAALGHLRYYCKFASPWQREAMRLMRAVQVLGISWSPGGGWARGLATEILSYSLDAASQSSKSPASKG